MLRLLSGVFLGWSLGSNDSANVFGTAVASRSIKYGTAILLASLFILIGALAEGMEGMYTLSGLTTQTFHTAFIASLAAGMTVTLMTLLNLPVSTSQGVVGAIIGIGMGTGEINMKGLEKVVLCWVGTPVGAAVLTMILYLIIGKILEAIPMNLITRGYVLKTGLIIAGCYGAYALGANNVANITGVYVQTGIMTGFQAVLLGGLSIVIGVLTYSKKVMMTVGKKLVKLDPFSSFITVLAHAIVVHLYAKIGVPVSTSQAIIGAVLGVGLLKGVQTIKLKVLAGILFGWIGTPIIAGIISFCLFRFTG